MTTPPAWLPDPDHRVIEIGPTDASVTECLRSYGVTKVLSLVEDPSAEVDPGARVAPLRSADDVRNHNADVLVLHGRFARALWYRRLGVARFVAFPADGAAAREAALACRVHRRPPLTRTSWGGREFLVAEVSSPRYDGARRYYSPVVGLGELASRLAAQNVRYVVLRWFDDLPHVEPGEDLDVLVADADLDTFVDVLSTEPGNLPADVYSETGLPGSDFKSIAYYPPAIATDILRRAVRLPSGFFAPCPEDHFLSLAYHAVYHKGYGSGIPSVHAHAGADAPDHDYVKVLNELGRAHGFNGAMTIEHLEQHLATHGWRPPVDALAKLAPHNRWVHDQFFGGDRPTVEPPELTTYLVRDRAADERSVAVAVEFLREQGFEIAHIGSLTPAARERCATGIRGGNWGKGPFAMSGGLPAVAIAALDPAPQTPSAAESRRHPGLTNARTLRTKLGLRDRLLDGIDESEQFNPLHSSDSDAEGWHYLELADPDAVAEVRRLVGERRAAIRSSAGTGGEVVRRSVRVRVADRVDEVVTLVRATAQRARWFVAARLRAAFMGAVRRRLRVERTPSRQGIR